MFSNWTFARRISAGYGLAGIAFAIVAGTAYSTTSDFIQDYTAMNRTQEVRRTFQNLQSDLTDAETSQRGYLLTGDDSYLDIYRETLAHVGMLLDAAQAATVDSPSRERSLAAIRQPIATKLDELRHTIELRRDAGLEAAIKVVATNEGKRAMDQVRSVIDELDRQEEARLQRRTAEAQASAARTLAVILWGGIAAVVLVGLVGWLVTRALSRQIADAISHVRSASAELQAAANQQATGLREQAVSISEITTTITELLATSRQIAEGAQNVAQIADQTASGASAGQGAIDIAQDAIGSIRRQVDQVVAHMLELGRKSQQIGAVLDIVQELAEQTNILAINATIEAAGAGEGGRRFAVVADEIRKLADRVGNSAKEIRGLIDDVRGAVNTTVMATETGSKAVDAGAQQFGGVAASFRRIAELVLATTDAAREIELSTKQQASAV
jgi:CHASE3 domain sensor protein